MDKQELLPIGQRVTHFDGGEHTHGSGTIVAYNNISEPSHDLQYVAKMMEEPGTSHPEIQSFLVQSAVAGMLNGQRCPYVVHWDPSEKYPEGYKDVYERESINPI